MARDIFANLDLNLLRTFIILYQEKNMRKASERLFVSQPAVSKALQRLRDHFSDDLFVKTHHGLKSTEFANTLAVRISPLIQELSIAVNQASQFNPNELTGVIKIALAPFLLSSLASKLFQAIRSEAPNVQVHLLNWSNSTMEELVKDEINLGINYEIGHAPKALAKELITTDSFSAYIREDHPYDKDSVNIDKHFDFEMATIIAADWNSHTSFAEKVMKMSGFIPKISFRSELPSAIVDVVLNSDMLFPASSMLEINKDDKLRKLPIMLNNTALKPEVYCYYHNSNTDNSLHHWLLQIIQTIVPSNNQ
ncbi:LysR family transcriptional regulator [Vibrio sp. 10N.261.55.A7]|uniref:LysR family transcriptional regulator n=1 Tax=Vibrio sp. 10N.261.55.A7 TaxID=1880851 RepID=UPI000C81D91E|nr:LysR family transcriptional regulator [Vibrio sp. 10N.261.55.A7]PMJ99865.1 LysR family transcriptional regulator [Vibrio sp. 10N.261.55.A7]